MATSAEARNGSSNPRGDERRSPQRSAAVSLALGALLFLGGSVIHPPTVRREDLTHVVREGATPMWLVDHWLLTLASVLITVGLAGFHTALSAHSGIRRGVAGLAAPLGAASAAFWIGLFVFEASGWPEIATVLAQSQTPSVSPLYPVAQALWSTSLALGYAGGVLLSAAIGVWSAAILATDDGGGAHHLTGVGWIGLVAAGIGILTQAAAWALPQIAIYLLIPAALALGLWIVVVVYHLWQRSV